MSNNTIRKSTATNPKGTTAMSKATTTATARVRKSVAKVAAPSVDKEQAQRERAAAGTHHIADLAVEAYRKALVNDLAVNRVVASKSKASTAMKAAKTRMAQP